MTEEEWLVSADPQAMLEFLRGKASERKLRLFACACFRRIWHVITNSTRAVDLGERFADGQASLGELKIAQEEAELIWHDPEFACDVALRHTFLGYSTLWLPDHDAAEVAEHCVLMASQAVAGPSWLANPEPKAQCQLLRCVVANPFRPITIHSTWLTPTVTNLANASYEQRAMLCGELHNARLAILADLLEEVGCDNQEILRHLRSPGPHVRGCSALDLLLGKE